MNSYQDVFFFGVAIGLLAGVLLASLWDLYHRVRDLRDDQREPRQNVKVSKAEQFYRRTGGRG